MNKDIQAYNNSQASEDKVICEKLAKIIQENLPNAENKIWHAHPVWFLDGNPIVGYHKLKDSVRILFWSGQSFDEPDLLPEGSFKAAETRYTNADQINETDLKRWLKKSQDIQWDYKNIVKRKGKLIEKNLGFAHILIVLLVLIPAAFIFYAYPKYFMRQESLARPTPKSTSTVTTKKEESVVPIEPEIIYAFDKRNSKVIVKHKTDVFVADDIQTNYFLTSEYNDAVGLEWKKFPVEFKNDESRPGRVLNVKKFPNKQAFLISVIGDDLTDKDGWDRVRHVYAIGHEGISDRKPLLTFADNTDTPWYPYITKISNNGEFVAFYLYSCWGCDSGTWKTLILKLDLDENSTRKQVMLGQAIDMTLHDDGSYSYRLRPTECDEYSQGQAETMACLQKNQKPLQFGKL